MDKVKNKNQKKLISSDDWNEERDAKPMLRENYPVQFDTSKSRKDNIFRIEYGRLFRLQDASEKTFNEYLNYRMSRSKITNRDAFIQYELRMLEGNSSIMSGMNSALERSPKNFERTFLYQQFLKNELTGVESNYSKVENKGKSVYPGSISLKERFIEQTRIWIIDEIIISTNIKKKKSLDYLLITMALINLGELDKTTMDFKQEHSELRTTITDVGREINQTFNKKYNSRTWTGIYDDTLWNSTHLENVQNAIIALIKNKSDVVPKIVAAIPQK